MELIASYPRDTPVVMVNILRYSKTGKDESESGEQAYTRYGLSVLPFLRKVGGRIRWRGKMHHPLVGESESNPHTFILVEYPSTDHFMQMVQDPEYQKVAKDRSFGLQYGGLFACETEMSDFSS